MSCWVLAWLIVLSLAVAWCMWATNCNTDTLRAILVRLGWPAPRDGGGRDGE